MEEARRKSAIKQLLGSSRIFLAPAEKPPQRPDLQGKLILQSKAAEHYRKGEEAAGKSQYEKAIVCFQKAVALQPEQVLGHRVHVSAGLYVSQAEAFLQLCDFQSAAAAYKQACDLQPGVFCPRLAFVYYLQGQCFLDQGLFDEALRAFSRAAEVKPSCRAYESRRLACLLAAGRLTDCLELLDGCISRSPTADLYVLRARLHKQLGQDAEAALGLSPACSDAAALLQQLLDAGEDARQQAVGRALSGQLHQALCLINVALELRPKDARLYLFRGTLFRRLKEFTAAIEDLIQTLELSEEDKSSSVHQEAPFQLVLTYNDFAVQCFGRGLYEEAIRLLNKAIEREKSLAGLYLNRGDCFFQQRDWCYALADYLQAEEMQPDEPAVRRRLAVTHNTLGTFCFQDGHFQDAVDEFSLAIRYNPTVSRYYESRSKAFRKLLRLRGAREDFICMLILDPSNEEVPPMLMNLFPGSSVSDVLDSPKGRAIRAKLTDTIQTWSSSHPERLSKSFQNMSVTNNNAASQSEAEMELSLCVNLQDAQMITNHLLGWKEKVKEPVPGRSGSHPPEPPTSSSRCSEGQTQQ
ncbi:unnamed protein product [Menidia menidia]|uniref:(Atlantic silverside) hypothetical protein n=1 Tax=Menidia menidia TaxID=238744 RepID=A0A8S4B1X9_9TELE|nr:unnamed protein product [Menidia menidia]